MDPFQADLIMYGEEVDDRIVIFDLYQGYLNHNYLENEGLELRYVVPDGGGGTSYKYYFTKAEWILRSNVWSLSLTPVGGSFSKPDAYSSIRGAFSHKSQWAKSGNATVDESMKNQLYCHYDWAGSFKVPWNLEPSKPDKGYAGFVLDLCN